MQEETKELALGQNRKDKDAPVKQPADFTDVNVLYDELVKSIRAYHPSDDLSIIEKAYLYAKKAHEGQCRKSGEPYIIHPVCVAIILAELELDKESIVAGLLHDVVEDTPVTSEDIAREFGDEVALLVDGVTKLTQISWAQDKVEIQAENLRKMFLAMAKDIRVILIKLADRLHNMRTLKYMKPEKQKEKARETMDIYAPIANRLGISKIKIELDDLSLQYLEPDVYKDLKEKVEQGQDDRMSFVNDIIAEVRTQLDKAGIEAKLEGRVKHIFSIYKKMVNQHKTFDQIYDVFAVRIITNDVKDCYAALGVIHEMYKPIPGRFKDYIAMPKPNMYQSLHTTLISTEGRPFEIQIRTMEMHRTAEYGIAAHWKYKEVGSGEVNLKGEEEKLNWLRQILEWQNDMSDNHEFLDVLKDDLNLFSDNVYCFTPSGDVKNLPKGSTPIDFAYSIHTAVGNRMVGARVNNKLVPINYEIQNGDRIEIITSQNTHGPSRDWLNMVKSSQAKTKINQWFRNQNKDDNISKGKELIQAYCKTKGYVLSDIYKPEYCNRVMAKYGFRDWDNVLAAVGYGGLSEGQVANKLKEAYDKKHKKELTDAEILASVGATTQMSDGTAGAPIPGQVSDVTPPAEVVAAQEEARHHRIKTKNGIVVSGVDDVAVRFSKCCNPVPGDEIVGFVTRGRGISIHRTDCVNMMNLPENERARMIEAEWSGTQEKTTEKYATEIKIFANHRIGIFVDLSKIFTEQQIDITSMNVRTNKQGLATIIMTFDISGKEELRGLVEKLRNVESVIDVERG